jgi:hypothetical protein
MRQRQPYTLLLRTPTDSHDPNHEPRRSSRVKQLTCDAASQASQDTAALAKAAKGKGKKVRKAKLEKTSQLSDEFTLEWIKLNHTYIYKLSSGCQPASSSAGLHAWVADSLLRFLDIAGLIGGGGGSLEEEDIPVGEGISGEAD